MRFMGKQDFKTISQRQENTVILHNFLMDIVDRM